MNRTYSTDKFNKYERGDYMTDSEKLDLLLTEMQGMKTEMQGMKADIINTNNRIDNLESQVKQTECALKNEIHKECFLVLDEVERVHAILDQHKYDKSVHTA